MTTLKPDPPDDQPPKSQWRVVAVKFGPSLVLTAALVLQLWQSCAPNMAAGFAAYWWHGTQDQFLQVWTEYDREAFKAAGGPDGGSISLMLLSLDANQNSHTNFAQGFICRGSYALYPHRVWAADEKTILNNGPDAIKARFNPTTEWLQSHDVHAVIVGVPAASGGVFVHIVPPVGAAP